MHRIASRTTWRRLGAVAGASLALAASPALAQDILVIEVTGGAPTAVVGGSNLLDLLEDAIESQGAFAAFDGTAFTASLDWGGVENAIQVSVNAAGTSATLSFPITGFSQTFTGATTDDLENQIEDFLLENGASAYADLIEALNRLSVVAIVDGNPGAATARLGMSAYRRWGQAPTFTPGIRVGGSLIEQGSMTTVAPTVGVMERGDFESEYVSLELQSMFAFNDTLGLSISTMLLYEDLEGADIFQGGLELALPINLIGGFRSSPTVTETASQADEDADGDGVIDDPPAGDLHLQVTPLISLGLGGSGDLGSGALFYGYGLGASVSKQFGSVTVSGGATLIRYDGLDVEYDDYEFETNVEQTMVTIGGMASFALSESLDLQAGVSWSNLLDDAAVDDWISPEVGLAFGGGNFRARIGWVGTFADEVDGHAVRAGLHWAF